MTGQLTYLDVCGLAAGAHQDAVMWSSWAESSGDPYCQARADHARRARKHWAQVRDDAEAANGGWRPNDGELLGQFEVGILPPSVKAAPWATLTTAYGQQIIDVDTGELT